MIQAGAVVVTYNSGGCAGACLDSCLRFGLPVVVVDNASQDETLDVVRRRQVKLICNPVNRGFAAAVNQGVDALPTPAVLILNPDAELISGFDRMLAALALPGTGLVGGKLIGSDGRPQSGFAVRRLPDAAALSFESLGLNALWPRNPVNRRYRCLDFDFEQRAVVEQPPAAFWLLRRSAWQQLGGFDEWFFPLWFEDVDFARRLRETGWIARYEPAAVARHQGGHSLERVSPAHRRTYWYASLLKYGVKHLRPWQLRLVCLSVMAGSAGRALWGISAGKAGGAAGYGRVFRLAFGCLLSGSVRASPGEPEGALG